MSEKVIVVGAGLAGLTAAYELSKDKEYEVHLLEANDYVGGRVRSLPVNGHPVDFGGFIIYPWYEQFHRILKELKLQDEIESIALKDIYYDVDGDRNYRTQADLDFPAADTLKLYPRLAFQVMAQDDMAEPDLDRFSNRTIAQHFRHILGVKHETIYERYTNVICQGYCYGPVDKYKMAFVAPILRFQRLYGNITTALYFRQGSAVFTEALTAAIEGNGGTIHLSSPVTKLQDKTVTTPSGTQTADKIIFAQPANSPLYQQALPEVAPGCEYTHFYTVTAKAEKIPTINGTSDWGGSFYKPERNVPFQILSSINLPALYGDALDGYVNLNIIVHDDVVQDPNLTIAEMYSEILPQLKVLFPRASWKALTQMHHWSVTMPIAQEKFVQQVRQAQGENGYYFAGDFLGSPSMETAVTTGLRAAKLVQGIADPTTAQRIQENAQRMQKKIAARISAKVRS